MRKNSVVIPLETKGILLVFSIVICFFNGLIFLALRVTNKCLTFRHRSLNIILEKRVASLCRKNRKRITIIIRIKHILEYFGRHRRINIVHSSG